MTNEEYCKEHCSNTNRIARSENDIQGLWRAIDQMRYMVMGGMLAVIVQVVVFVMGKI